MKNPIKVLIAICSIIFIAIPIIFYIIQFCNYSFSDSPEHWGQFGDYFGGTLNPLLSIINIIVFIYLTFEIQKFNDSSNDKNLKIQQKIALMTFQMEAYKELKEKVDNVEKKLANYSDYVEYGINRYQNMINEIKILDDFLLKFANRYGFLFSFMEKKANEKSINDFIMQIRVSISLMNKDFKPVRTTEENYNDKIWKFVTFIENDTPTLLIKLQNQITDSTPC